MSQMTPDQTVGQPAPQRNLVDTRNDDDYMTNESGLFASVTAAAVEQKLQELMG